MALLAAQRSGGVAVALRGAGLREELRAADDFIGLLEGRIVMGKPTDFLTGVVRGRASSGMLGRIEVRLSMGLGGRADVIFFMGDERRPEARGAGLRGMGLERGLLIYGLEFV